MKLKKWLLGLATFAAMVVICAVCAGAETYGDYEYSVLNDGTVKITDYNGGAEKVEIPEMIDGRSVTSIGNYAFEYCENITSVTIPNSVTSIGEYAFSGCESLISVTILSGVTSIGDYAFEDCTSLTNITIPNSVTDIGRSAFSGCTSIKSITIPDSVTSIGSSAFYGCTSLTSIMIPDSVTRIDSSAFGGCSSLTAINVATENQNYVSVNGVLYNKNKTTIMRYPAGKKAKNYKIPDGVTSIGDYTFEDCISLTSITIPDSVTRIGDSAFNGCTSLTNITIPNSVTDIGRSAFEGCSSLTSITIPDSVTWIGYSAFEGCASLTSITIPDSVTIIENCAFKDCTSLTAINVATGNQNYVSVNGVLYDVDKTAIICYPAGKKDKNCKILDGVTFIDRFAFSGCTNVTSITIPVSVTSIDKYAFSGCLSLKSITIPVSVTSIDKYAFRGCSSLTSITIPNSVTEIGSYAFSDCSSLTSITIPDGATSIGNWAFKDCTSLASVTIPSSVAEIGGYVFENCISLTEIKVASTNSNFASVDGILYDKDKTTIKCYPAGKKNESYTINDGVMYIGSEAFEYCVNLKSVIIPNSVKSIEAYAFIGCANLRSVTIPDSVTQIDREAFENCKNLMSVTIPSCVENIYVFAFGYYYDNGYKKIDNFKIYCYSGTEGEKYAKENGFDYELITAEKPANVTGFKVKSLTSTNVTLQWNKNSSASGYEIEQYKGGKWVNVAKITGNATTSYTVKGLAAGTAGYKFRMRAVKNGAYSDYTSALSVNTNPYGVGGFKCSSKTSTSVTLKWNKGTTASGYQLQQYKDGKWVTIYTGTKATNTSYTVKGLKAGTAGYRFRIRAYKTYGNTKQYGSWSSEVKVNTNPYGVGGFKCSSKTSTSVTLKWNKGTTASGYQLQQYKDGKWVTIYTGTKATNTSYTVKGLKAGTAGYRFRIRAYKTYGNTKQYGSWSSEVKVNTNPYGVGGFKAKSTSKNSITLGWNKGTTASGYQLQQYKGGKWVTVYTGTKATSTSCTIKSLKANTSYKFRIRAYKTYGNTKQYGSWSKELTVKTKR